MKSKYFRREEFACKCGCGFDVVDTELEDVLIGLREWAQKAVIITNACRCAKHNAEVGGSPKSQHVLGKAADVVVIGVTPDEVADFLDTQYPAKFGVGRYDTFTHVDVRGKRARWDNRKTS